MATLVWRLSNVSAANNMQMIMLIPATIGPTPAVNAPITIQKTDQVAMLTSIAAKVLCLRAKAALTEKNPMHKTDKPAKI
ncbi:MAG TPA: hypothetical protein VMT46_00725 [Anaerolineaceae bacterium]|nr:hypothetical protein [Anaerolineaceae bacterium]